MCSVLWFLKVHMLCLSLCLRELMHSKIWLPWLIWLVVGGRVASGFAANACESWVGSSRPWSFWIGVIQHFTHWLSDFLHRLLIRSRHRGQCKLQRLRFKCFQILVLSLMVQYFSTLLISLCVWMCILYYIHVVCTSNFIFFVSDCYLYAKYALNGNCFLL